MALKFTTVPPKTLLETIDGTATSFQLSDILSWKGVSDGVSNLQSSDFGDTLYAVFRNDNLTQLEIMKIDPATIANNSITVLARGLSFSGDLSTEDSTKKLTWVKGETIVELGANPPQIYEALLEYINGISISGAANATQTTKGIVEIATAAEINAGTATGGTGASIAITPDQLALSSMGLLYASLTGAVMMYAGSAAPSGFLLCNGASNSMDTYPALAAVVLGKYGLYGTNKIFTASGNTLTATSHGYTNGQRILLYNVGGALPTGLAANTIYFVISATTNTLQLSATSGGSVITLSGSGTGTQYMTNQFSLPDMRSSMPLGVGTRTFALAYDSTINTQVANVQISTVTAVSSATITAAVAVTFAAGDPIYFTGSVPSNLTANTLYYAGAASASTTFSIATTYQNAVAGTYIANVGTGTGAGISPVTSFVSPTNLPGALVTGTPLTMTTTGALPTNVVAATTYYAYRYSNTRIYLTSSQTFPQANIVNAEGVGTGIHTITATLSARALGDSGGEENHELTVAEMPAHTHGYSGGSNNNSVGQNGVATNNTFAAQTGSTGGDAPHNNMPPFTAVNFIIKT